MHLVKYNSELILRYEGRNIKCMNILIWGVGKVLERDIKQLNLNEVCYFIDKEKEKQKRKYFGIKVLSPDMLNELEFDFIVISSSKYFIEITKELVCEYGINSSRILNWKYYIGMTGQKEYKNNFFEIKCLLKACLNFELYKILDVDMLLGKTTQLDRSSFLHKNMIIDAIQDQKEDSIYKFRKAQYRKIWKKDLKIEEFYDIVWLHNLQEEKSLSEAKDFLNVADLIIFKIERKFLENISKLTEHISVINIDGFLFGVLQKDKKKIEIYEVTHKEFKPINEDGYIPIYAGNRRELIDKYIGDNTGDNISDWNNIINEATTMYWMWKNTKTPFIGLNHYRRFFSSCVNAGGAMQNIEWQILLKQYDIIVAEVVYFNELVVKEALKSTVCAESFNESFDIIYNIFKRKGNAELQAFEDIVNGHMFYPCNMFVTTAVIYHEYCSWLFPIIFQMLDQITIKEEWDNYSKRIIGFWIERLFTVWLIQKEYKIKSTPILLIGSGAPYGKEENIDNSNHNDS